MVILDQFAKMIRLKVTMTVVLLKDITKVYWDYIWRLHGVPQKVLSNREPQFASKFMEDLIKSLKTKRTLSTVYHPYTDGQTEQINQEFEVFLRHYVNYQQDNWTEWLSAVEFQYNNKKYAATVCTLFKLNFERHL